MKRSTEGKAERNASSKRTKPHFQNIRERGFVFHNYADRMAKLDLKRAQDDVVPFASRSESLKVLSIRSKDCIDFSQGKERLPSFIQSTAFNQRSLYDSPL
jgi:hypothetical protein